MNPGTVGPGVDGTVGLVLPTHDLGHRAEHLGLLDHVGAERGDALLVLAGDQHGGPAGDRVVQRQLADVVHQRGVLELEQLRLVDAELAADGDREPADPFGMAGFHVPADLGHLGERPHGLQVGGPDPGVPAERHLGNEQRQGEHGQRLQPHHLRRERDEQRRSSHRRAQRQLNVHLVHQRHPEPGSLLVDPQQGGEHRLEQQGEHGQGGHQREGQDPVPVHGAVSRQRAENVGDARDAEQADGHAAHPGGPADSQVRQRADDHADGGHGHHLLGAVLAEVTADPDEQGVGERSGEPDRGGLAVPRQVEPEHLAERDQRAERDGGPGILQATRRGLRHRGYQPNPGGHHEQQLAGIPHLPGIPAELISAHAHRDVRGCRPREAAWLGRRDLGRLRWPGHQPLARAARDAASLRA